MPTIVVKKGNYSWSFCSHFATGALPAACLCLRLTPGMRIKLRPITSHTLHPGFDNPVTNLLTFYPCSQSVRRFCLLLAFDLSVSIKTQYCLKKVPFKRASFPHLSSQGDFCYYHPFNLSSRFFIYNHDHYICPFRHSRSRHHLPHSSSYPYALRYHNHQTSARARGKLNCTLCPFLGSQGTPSWFRPALPHPLPYLPPPTCRICRVPCIWCPVV